MGVIQSFIVGAAAVLLMNSSASAQERTIESSGDLGLPQPAAEPIPAGGSYQPTAESPPADNGTIPLERQAPPPSDITIPVGGTYQPPADHIPAEEVTTTDNGYKHFEAWLEEFRAEAMRKGITQDVLDDAFADLDEPSEDVIEKDQTQPEVKQTWPRYITAVLTQRKIDAARKALTQNRDLLNRIEAAYGVQPQFVVALWGMESNFGQHQGSHSIIESLTTLAYDGRRAAFFRAELINALTIMQQEHIRGADLLGSWAGAMGQVQFMPSSFLRYAVDFDGNGKRDIWSDDADALASIANYLHQKGWDDNAGWGISVALPENTETDWTSMKERMPLATWKKFGVRQKNGDRLQGVKAEARLVLLDGDKDQAYLVTSNYDVLMDWNRSVYFATSIGMLADAIGDD